MTDRRCPYCSELVPSNSITCPACYKKIPRDIETGNTQQSGNERDSGPKIKRKSKGIAIGLAVIPGVFGFMGLGQMYMGRYRKGLIFLALGLPMMLLMALLISSMGDLSAGWTILSIGLLLLIGIPYVMLFFIQLLDAAASSILQGSITSYSP